MRLLRTAPGRFRLYGSQSLTLFTDLNLAAPLLKALTEENYTIPTPIQAQAIPVVLEGRDLLGIAQTGTGKTAAFALPILDRILANRRRPSPKSARVLVLSPTRELSGQILDAFNTYGRHLRPSSTLVIGGVPMGRQIRAMQPGVEILVATPGRLLDLVRQGCARLDEVEVLVLDEADQMLDLGFIHSIRALVAKLPRDRQTLFFSATMPKAIAELASGILRDPVQVAVTPIAKTADRVEQGVIFASKSEKGPLLAKIIKEQGVERALVFTRTKRGADVVVRGLGAAGIAADAIHGNKSQNQRDRTLALFREGRTRILVATDIAARGIDVEGISHVVNFDLPNVPESYVHRIGRTARAGAAGIAISFCDGEERAYLRQIERLTQNKIPVLGGTPGREPSGGSSDARREAGPGRDGPRPASRPRPAGGGGYGDRGRSGSGRPGGGERSGAGRQGGERSAAGDGVQSVGFLQRREPSQRDDQQASSGGPRRPQR